jgi:putative transposase
MSERKPDPSDLTDLEWEIAQPVIPPPKPGGRRREVDMYEVLNAIFYVLKSGFPPKGTVYHYFNTWRKDGTWAAINDQIREQLREELAEKSLPAPRVSNRTYPAANCGEASFGWRKQNAP